MNGEIIMWGPRPLSDLFLGPASDILPKTLYLLGIYPIYSSWIDEGERGLEAALRVAVRRASVVCVACIPDQGWQERLHLLPKMVAKISQRRLTLHGQGGFGLLPDGTEVFADPGGIPFLSLSFSISNRKQPVLLIITPGGEAVLEHFAPKIEEIIFKTFGREGKGLWIRMCGVDKADLGRWIEQGPFDVEVRFKIFPALAGLDLLLTSQQGTVLDRASAAVQSKWGRFCYSFRGERLEEVVGRLLLSQGKYLTIAESCTGGRIAARMTRVPGSSRYFDSACVTYSNRSKESLLSVPRDILQEKGAVSSEVASSMAEGARQKRDVDLGLAVTGIAGPGGGSPQKPVGLVYVALSDRSQTFFFPFRFQGDREAIQSQAAQVALDTIRRYLEGIKS